MKHVISWVYKGCVLHSKSLCLKMPSAPHLPARPQMLRSHNVQKKLEALQFAEQYGDRDAAYCYNTTPKSIRDWRKSEGYLKRKAADGKAI